MLVVVAMGMLLVDVDADIPALGVAREEEVAEEVTDDRARLLGPVERAADVVDAEPHNEALLRAHLWWRFAIVGRVEHQVGVLGLEPARSRVARAALQA